MRLPCILKGESTLFLDFKKVKDNEGHLLISSQVERMLAWKIIQVS